MVTFFFNNKDQNCLLYHVFALWHVDLLLKLNDVQIAFGILIHCYAQHPLYLLCCTPLIPTLIKSFVYFDYSFLQMFGSLMGLWSFDSPERFLGHKQAFLPITLGGIRFISTSTIAPTTYLRSWALIVSIITVRFMVD